MKAASQTEFEHVMLREIYEQPQTLAETIGRYAPRGGLSQDAFSRVAEVLGGRQRLIVAASGSSRHAGQSAEIMIEDLAGLAVDVEYASEYTYRSTQTVLDPALLVISQSGETVDTLAALRQGKSQGLPTLAITNHPGSSMSRDADVSMPTCAGKESAIPATKSFTAQLAVLYSLALFLAGQSGRMTSQVLGAHCDSLRRLPELLDSRIGAWDRQIANLAPELKSARAFLYLGRGVHYPIAREGALKVKESAYLQAQGYPAGELKHGPNALVAADTPLIFLATRDPSDADAMRRYQKVIQLMREMRDEGAMIVSVATEGDADAAALSRISIAIPPVEDMLATIAEAIPLQLLAYHLALENGVDMDHPRHLVKAVLQE